MQFSVPDMSCQHCVNSIQTALAQHIPGAQVQVNLASRTVNIDTPFPEDRVLAALEEAGFDAQRIDHA